MRLLALDAATEACSVALLCAPTPGAPTPGAPPSAAQQIIGRFEEPGRGHADRILALVEEVLQEAGIGLADLDAIACGIGPGGFTGVRIAVATAQGLAFGASLPVVPVTTLEALALPALAPPDDAPPAPAVAGGAAWVLACLDARMNEVYWGCYVADGPRGVRALRPPAVSSAAALLEALRVNPMPRAPAFPCRGVGRGFAAHPLLRTLAGLELPPGADTALPDARDVARLGALRFAAGEGIDPAQLTPLYIRDKVAWTEAERGAP